MAARIALRIEAPAWRAAMPGCERLARRAARAALSADATAPEGELCLVLADDRLQRALNRLFRGKDRSTNVLSFDSAPAGLGDVVLALETVQAEAEAQGKSLADHVSHLVVHGVLHLMGHDHVGAADARRMERLEGEILADLGIGDPYRLPAPGRSRSKTRHAKTSGAKTS
ncbi:MAG TPA: rRNA maturation RNase YbeY [Candidatus Udaeobacter sp.]|nr:rRNA maturation RNase YbeY [Candidatus Udaeobacter sp.]